MHREERGPGQIGFSEHDFKVCELCGALNRVANHECFVCGWRGMFRRDPETVREAMIEFEMRHGPISEAMIAEELLPDERVSGLGFFSTLVEKIKRFLGG